MKTRITAYTPNEWEELNVLIHGKVNLKQHLNAFEVRFFCESMPPHHQIEYPVCQEYLFRGLFLRSLNFGDTPANLKLSEKEQDLLEQFAKEWEVKVVAVGNHPSPTLQYIAKETRLEIKKIETDKDYNAKLYHTLLMSRFIYFKVAFDFFLGYTQKEVIISSLFGDIYFTDYSLSHILFRHYAAGAKGYHPNQSFFSKDITISSIHKFVALILGWISKTGITITQPLNHAITVKYKEIFYQLYLKKVLKPKVKGNVSIIRVETFYPINDSTILKNIASLQAHSVFKDLTIFEQ